MQFEEIIKKLKSLSDKRIVRGGQKYGIKSRNMLGISIPKLRKLAKEIGKNHELAVKLWNSEIHEAQILASMVDEPDRVTERQMEKWVKDFDSWAICDQVCSNLFDKTPYAYQKAIEWSKKEKEYVKRAGFVLMATLAVHDKKAPDEKFIRFFAIIKREASDERNFVKKAVNWALRQIGKRNQYLRKIAIETAWKIQKINSKSARWIASDAIREFRCNIKS